MNTPYRKVNTLKRQLLGLWKSDELDSLLKSIDPDTSHNTGELIGPIDNCGYLDKRLSHGLLVAWGIFNPYGPTWCSLTLATVPGKRLSLIYLKISNPFSIESFVHGWVREPTKSEILMRLLISMFNEKEIGKSLQCAPTFIAYCPNSIINLDHIATVMYGAFTLTLVKGLNEECEKMRKNWLRPWDRTPSYGKLIEGFIEQHSLAVAKTEHEREDLIIPFVKYLREKEKNLSTLTQRSFLDWFNLVTDSEHVVEECKQMWGAWDGAIEYVGKGLSSTNAKEGLSFHCNLLRTGQTGGDN
jgi:hypothetical protein